MINLQTQILNHEWKKCKGCSGTREQLGLFAKYSAGMLCNMQTCEECKGNKFETMEIENPIWNGIYKYIEDEIIKLDIPWEVLGCFPNYRGKLIKKFKIIKTDNKTGWGIVPVGEK